MNTKIILLSLLLAGCSTTTVVKPKINAPADIMKDCEDFVIPKNGSLSEFANVLIENKKVYELCKVQNKAKKDFIIKHY